MKTYYLAHSVPLWKFVRKWQLNVEKKYRIKFKNPFFRNKWEIEQMQKIEKLPKEEQAKGLESLTLQSCFRIMNEDLTLIRQSDGLVAFFDDPTIGTCQEIFAAAYLYNMPVYIITSKYKHHAWLRALAALSGGKIFDNMIEFTNWLKKRGLKR